MPEHFLFEPIVKFQHQGQDLFWAPDAVITLRTGGKVRVYVIEVQLTHLTPKKWANKWGIYNMFFNKRYHENAPFQSWSKSGRIILPQFVAITRQKSDDVKNGFEVEGRVLIVTKEME